MNMPNYYAEIDRIQALIISDFNYVNKQQSAIDLRLNELGKRGSIEETAAEMEELLIQRRVVKDATLTLLPLRDLFKNGWTEVGERMAKSETHRLTRDE